MKFCRVILRLFFWRILLFLLFRNMRAQSGDDLNLYHVLCRQRFRMGSAALLLE